MCSQLDLWLDPTCGFARCRPYGVFCLCHVDVALRPMKIPKFEVVWLVVDLLCLPRVFCRVLALAVCQPLAVVLGLIRVVLSHGSLTLSFHSRATLLTPRTPLNREGAWCCDFARAGFRQDIGYFPIKGVVIPPFITKASFC